MSGVLYDSKVEAWKHSDEPRKLEREARYLEAETRPILRAQRAITFYPEGSLVRIEGSCDYEPHERPQGKRGKIGGFSARSRLRLMTLCAMLKRTALPLFVTLTWPGVWNPDPKTWKRCLDSFLKRMKRAHPEASAIWKLEPQQHGAPHYHLLLFGIEFIPHQVIARWWYEVVGSGDKRHLGAGISIEAVKSRDRVMAYASKLYMGKEIDGFEGVGRFWGVFSRGKLPVSLSMRKDVAAVVLVKFTRIARRFIRAKTKASFLWKRALGIPAKWRPFRCTHPARIFTDDPAQWGRVLDWADNKYYGDLALVGQPF